MSAGSGSITVSSFSHNGPITWLMLAYIKTVSVNIPVDESVHVAPLLVQEAQITLFLWDTNTLASVTQPLVSHYKQDWFWLVQYPQGHCGETSKTFWGITLCTVLRHLSFFSDFLMLRVSSIVPQLQGCSTMECEEAKAPEIFECTVPTGAQRKEIVCSIPLGCFYLVLKDPNGNSVI